MGEQRAWRVGRRVGRTVYIGDTLVGLMDTPASAAQVVGAVNGYDDLLRLARATAMFHEDPSRTIRLAHPEGRRAYAALCAAIDALPVSVRAQLAEEQR